jgi:hypothetical protein
MGMPRTARGTAGRRGAAALALLVVALAPVPAARADLSVPPGFTVEVYVTGQGFESGGDRSSRGFPGVGSLSVDAAGLLYLGRLGARFRQGEADDLAPLYRIPAGGAKLTPETESRFFHGPPLPNSVVGAVPGAADLLLTTYDRDRRLGALYRMLDGRARLIAGGTPTDGAAPMFRQPEGTAVDAEGRLFVADRERNAVVRLDRTGKVLDAEYVKVPRPRLLAMDSAGNLWVAADGTAETPLQDGVGQLIRVAPDGKRTTVLEGPLPAGVAVSPGGRLFVAQRRTGHLFAVSPEGQRLDFGSGTDGWFLRAVAFVPVTAATRRAGLAGDLLVAVARRQAWMLTEIYRISGPFDDFGRAP